MSQNNPAVSDAFRTFMTEAPEFAQTLMRAVEGWSEASALDPKTRALAYLAVLAATRMDSGVPFHTSIAKSCGASRQEVIGAILVGLPACGIGVTQVLPAALAAFDQS